MIQVMVIVRAAIKDTKYQQVDCVWCKNPVIDIARVSKARISVGYVIKAIYQ